MKTSLLAATISGAVVGSLLSCVIRASAQTGSVLNLAGADATCLKDPAQLSSLERERAMLAGRMHRPLSIIALSQDDAERFEREGRVQWCSSCGFSANSSAVLACIGDAPPSEHGNPADAYSRDRPEPAGNPTFRSMGPPPELAAPGGQAEQPAAAQRNASGIDVDRQWREQAVALVQNQQWSGLNNLANRWVQADPSWPPAWFYRGMANEWLGHVNQAQSDYGQAVSLNPRMALAQFGWGRALVEGQKYQPAIAPLQIAVRAFPADAHAWMNLGIALEQTGDRIGALAALQRAAKLAPNDLYIAGKAGEAYMLDRRWSEAAPLLERAISKQPFTAVNGDWMDELGGAYFMLGDYRRSAQVFEATLNVDSADPNTWYYLWQDYTKLGDTARAGPAHQTMTNLTNPARPLRANSMGIMAFMDSVHRSEHEAYLHNTGQLNQNEHLH